MSTPEYCRAVEAAREHIFAGDIFQVVLAQRFDLEGTYEPFGVYRVLRQVNPSPYMYFVQPRGGDARRIVAGADGAGDSTAAWSAGRSRGRASGAAARSTTGGWPPS